MTTTGLISLRVVGRLTILAAGAIALGVVYVIARHLGITEKAGTEPIVVMLGAFLLLGIPVAGMDKPRGRGFIAAGIGIIATQALWSVLRYKVLPEHRHRRAPTLSGNVRWGLRWGLGYAALFSLYAALIIGVASISGTRSFLGATSLALVVAAYVAGGVIGGVIAGLVRPLSHWPLGAMAMGVLTAIPLA